MLSLSGSGSVSGTVRVRECVSACSHVTRKLCPHAFQTERTRRPQTPTIPATHRHPSRHSLQFLMANSSAHTSPRWRVAQKRSILISTNNPGRQHCGPNALHGIIIIIIKRKPKLRLANFRCDCARPVRGIESIAASSASRRPFRQFHYGNKSPLTLAFSRTQHKWGRK